jgi:tetratricopeptide (TPR) repeat protein
MCYFWLENYEKAIESFRKVKLMQQNLFYLSACYFKLDAFDKAIESLKEAEVVSELDVDTFIKSLPYTKPKMIEFFNSCFPK